MADVFNKVTNQFLRSVSENETDYPTATWIWSPTINATPFRDAGVPTKYVNVTGDVLTEMDAGEKAVVDAAEAAAVTQGNRDVAIGNTTSVDGVGVETRALIELLNKRDNYLTNRLLELQAAMDAMKASTGNVANLRDAIPANWLATATRTKADAITDYTDDINAGNQDT